MKKMENRINYQRELDKLIERVCINEGKKPFLLLHSCCGPCSSYVLEYLTKYFNVTVYFYNPNIHPKEEYIKRLEAQKKVLLKMGFEDSVKLIEGDYDTESFFHEVRGLEDEPEGKGRCEKCISMRMKKTADTAKGLGAEYFATTLTVSPHKNALYINKAGSLLEGEKSVYYLLSDFKKKNGYKRSIELCHEYDIYRQNYCGCIYSIRKEN